MSQPENVQWLTPVAVLVIGFIVGAVVLLRSRRSSLPEHGAAPGRNDLQLEFDAMISRLRELAAAGEAFESERYQLEREAAVILRQLNAAPSVDIEEASAVSPSGNRALRLMMWATGSCVTLAILYVVLMQSTAPRPQDGVVTGGMPTGDTTLAALEQQLAAEPANLELRVELVRNLLERGDMTGVMRETGAILERQPDHPRASSYRALAVLAAGDSDTALDLLNRALTRQPDLVEAWIHLSLVHTQRGDRAKAIEALQTAQRHAPESAEMINTLEREIGARFDESAGAATPAPAGAVSYPIRISGADVAGGVIFVALRPAGVATGPPIAVKRIDATTLPIDLVLTSGDAMQGGALPATARIDVRVDSDGNVSTREEGAAAASADGVKAGALTQLILR